MKLLLCLLLLASPIEVKSQEIDADTIELGPRAFVVCQTEFQSLVVDFRGDGNPVTGKVLYNSRGLNSKEWAGKGGEFVEYAFDVSNGRFEFRPTYTSEIRPVVTQFNFSMDDCVFMLR